MKYFVIITAMLSGEPYDIKLATPWHYGPTEAACNRFAADIIRKHYRRMAGLKIRNVECKLKAREVDG